MSAGPTLRGLVVGDDPATWQALGFTMTGDRFTVGGVTVVCDPAATPGLRSWSLQPPAAGPIEGLAHDPAPAEVDESSHANAVTAIDHVVVGTSDVDRTTAALRRAGLRPRRTVTGIRGGDATYRFFSLGTALLELIGPAPDLRRSPRPASFVGLAFVTEDLDAAVAVAGLRAPHDAVQPGRRIATAGGAGPPPSVPVAFLSPRGE